MKVNILSFLIIFSILLTSCSTIGTQQYTYVGDVTQEKNVMGKSTHYDFYGLGISASSYGNEYNNAVKDAFRNSPKGTMELRSTKIFKENKSWPQVLGVLAMTVGLGLLSANTDSSAENSLSIPLTVLFSGIGLFGVNTYDFVLIGEPVK